MQTIKMFCYEQENNVNVLCCVITFVALFKFCHFWTKFWGLLRGQFHLSGHLAISRGWPLDRGFTDVSLHVLYTREYMPEESLDFHLLSQLTFKYHAILRWTLSTRISAIFVQRPEEVAPELAQPQFRRG